MEFIKEEGHQIACLVNIDNGGAIAMTLASTLKEAEANARLIAAAPKTKQQRDDLLEALKKALKNMDGDAVQCNGEWQSGLFCGLEDMDITDRYDACMHGYNKALDKVQEWVLCGFEEAIEEAIEKAEF